MLLPTNQIFFKLRTSAGFFQKFENDDRLGWPLPAILDILLSFSHLVLPFPETRLCSMTLAGFGICQIQVSTSATVRAAPNAESYLQQW